MTVSSHRDEFMPASKDSTDGQLSGTFSLSHTIDVDQWCRGVGGFEIFPLSPPDTASNCTVMDQDDTWNQASLPDPEWTTDKIHGDDTLQIPGSEEIWPAFHQTLQPQDMHPPNGISWTDETHGSVDFVLSPVLSYQSHNSHGLSSYTTSDLGSIPPGLDLSFIEPAWHVNDPSDASNHHLLHADVAISSENFSPTAQYPTNWTNDGPHNALVVDLDQHSHVTSSMDPPISAISEAGPAMYSYDASSSVQAAQMSHRAIRPVPQVQGNPVSNAQATGSGMATSGDVQYSANVPVIHVVASPSPMLQRRYVSLAPSPSAPAPGLQPVPPRNGPPGSLSMESNPNQPLVSAPLQHGEHFTTSAPPGPTVNEESKPNIGHDHFSDRRSSLGQPAESNYGSAGPALTAPSQAESSRALLVEAPVTHEVEEGRHRNHPLYSQGPLEDGLYHCPYTEEYKCQHKPTKLKCNYDKFIDSHLKPFRCKFEACSKLEFSSTACLLRHEREAHGMHGHGERPHLCYYPGCDRGLPGNGFPRRYNLFDHMKRVHNHHVKKEVDPSPSDSRKPAPSRKRKVSSDGLAEPATKHVKSEPAPPARSTAAAVPIPIPAPAPVLVGGLASPPMARLELEYGYQQNRPIRRTDQEQRQLYTEWAKKREHVARQLGVVQSPEDELNLQRLSQDIAELRRLSEEARHS